MQLKSVTNLDRRRKDGFLIYDEIKVKDLKHWEAFNQPVVLVWDVGLKEGRWALDEDVIADLDQRRPNWRENKSKVRVFIPWGNTTDNTGLKKLTRNIYRKTQLQISQKTPIEQIHIQFTFPDTEEGRTTAKALERSIKEGEPITIKGFVSDFKLLPEKLMYWHSDIDLKSVTFSLDTVVSSQTYSAYVDVTNSAGRVVSIPPVEFKVVKFGVEVTHLSNEHQDSPLCFHLTIPNQPGGETTVTLALTLNHTGRIAYETEQTQNFLDAIAESGTLNLKPLTENNALLLGTVSFNLEEMFNSQILSYFNKVALIQEKTAHFIKFPRNELTEEDIKTINKLVEIVTCGTSTTQNIKITGNFQKKLF